MRIPESFIQEVILRNPLEEVVAQYATLKRAGNNLVCCCPFHHEKTPSFTLYSSPSHYYCYGCGVGGDVITFVRSMENLDYVAAVELLAKRAGLPMPVASPGEKRVDKQRFYDMNAEAARFWYNHLMSEEGKVGLEYLLGRGLTPPIIKRFGLGYAPDSWDSLCQHLIKKGYKAQEIKEAFLGGISKSGKLFDYFRGRAMFPIFDVSGNVVAFSGRQVAPMKEGDRKYFNTNDTPVFKKSRTVFALNFAKNSPEKELILCEGNMDAVSLHAHGISNAVASLGTALTTDQCRLLARYSQKVTICYDGDSAGKRATEKAIRLLQEQGIKVRVMTLSGTDKNGKEVKDPDDFVRAFGKMAFEKAAAEAPGAIEYLFSQIREGRDLSTMDGKDEFIKECTALFATVQSPVEKELYVARAAELTGIPSDVIRLQTEKLTAKNQKAMVKDLVQKELQKSQGLGNRINPDKAKFVSAATKEENILGILLLRPEYLSDKKCLSYIDPELFTCEFPKKVLIAMLEMTGEDREFSFGALNEIFSPEEMGELERLKKKREDLGRNDPEILGELFLRLKEEKEKKESRQAPLNDAWLEQLKAEKSRKESK